MQVRTCASASYSQINFVVVEVVSGLITVYRPVLVCSMFELVVISKTCPATMCMDCSKHKLLLSMLHYTYCHEVTRPPKYVAPRTPYFEVRRPQDTLLGSTSPPADTLLRSKLSSFEVDCPPFWGTVYFEGKCRGASYFEVKCPEDILLQSKLSWGRNNRGMSLISEIVITIIANTYSLL